MGRLFTLALLATLGFAACPASGQPLQESEPPVRAVPVPPQGRVIYQAAPSSPTDATLELEAELLEPPWSPPLSPETGLRLWDCIVLSLENNRPLRNVRDDLRVSQVTLRENIEEFGNIYFLGAGAHYDENLAHTDFDRYSFSFGGVEGGVVGRGDGTILSRRFPSGGALTLGGRSTYQSSEFLRVVPLLDGMGNPVVDADGNPVFTDSFEDVRWFSEANIAISQPLLEGAGDVALTDLRLAELDQAISNLSLERFIQGLLNDVVRAFLGVQRSISLAMVQQRSYQLAIDQYQRSVDMGREREPLTVVRAKQQVASTKQSLIDSKNNYESSLIDLRLVMGIDPNQDIILAGTQTPIFPPPQFAKEESIKRALVNRPDFRSLAITQRQAELNLRRSQNALLPNLDLSARAGFREDDDDLLQSWELVEYQDVGADLRLNLPLNLPSDRANFERSQIFLRQTITDIEQRRRVITNEVDESFRAQMTLFERIDILRRNEDLARRTYEMLKQLADLGERIDPFDVVQAQEDWTIASAGRVRAEIDYLIALAGLEFSMGQPISDVIARYSPDGVPPR